MVKIKNVTPNAVEDAEKLDYLCISGGKEDGTVTLGKWQILKM